MLDRLIVWMGLLNELHIVYQASKHPKAARENEERPRGGP